MALDNPSYFTVAGAQPGDKHAEMGNSGSGVEDAKHQDRKKAYRNLLRSVSTNSADSNQDLLIMGEPRLSDIAPSFKVEPRRANSLKSNKSEIRSDLVYSPLATSEDAVGSDVSDDEEVFLNEDSATYYNVTAKAGSAASRRRHSISSFVGRERTVSLASSSKSFKEDLPQAVLHATPDGVSVKSTSISIDDHSLRHGSYPRKRCNRCTRGSVKRSADMDDILIISVKGSEAATLWVDYFTTYFEKSCKQANRKPYKIYHLGIEDIIEANGDIRLIGEKTAGVKLQLIVLCPTLLEQISENFQATGSLSKILIPDRILALQLGTSDEDITDIHKNALNGFSQWQRRGVGEDQDQKFVQDFLTAAMSIFTKVWKQQSSIATEENSQFSVSPKKIRQGQTSILILLTYPLQKEDAVKITIVKNDVLTEVKTVKRRNPYTLKVSIPEQFLEVSAIVNILVEKNGSFIGKRPIKCESRLRELEQILRSSNNPTEFMCQTLGFSPHDTEQLDNWMVHMFQKNVPPNFNLFINHGAYTTNKHSCEEYPTLLHFAARFGLEKLAVQLLDCPGGDVACEIRNINDSIPADIADNVGHAEIAHMLRGYMKMNEFTSMYTKLKDLTGNSSPSKTNEEETYLEPKKAENFYKFCPAPKPVHPQTSPTIMEEPSQYLQMNLNQTITPMTTPTTSPCVEALPCLPPPNSKPKKSHHASHSSINSSTHSDSPKLPKNSPVVEDKVQVELAEIMNDFKNNVHTIAQTERLVAEWKSRNDVQKSFKEKKDQLKQMRFTYEQIQRDMKTNTKKASPFDRIKKLFAWGSKDEKLDVGYPQNPQKNDVNISSQRPISSLSLQSTSSSSSSGRMSTISGCSLGDSGTHSDHEERKNIINNHSDEEYRPTGGFTYLNPPTPKPVKPVSFSIKNMCPTIEERPPLAFPRPELENETYYIHFPPNGSLVEGCAEYLEVGFGESESNKSEPSREYMNLPAPAEERLSHEYMNLKAP